MQTELSFVLVSTTHSGNIGASARAIKNMGFTDLRLVNCCSHMTKDAIGRASGADDVLKEAKRYGSLDEAVADCQIVIGTSARDRHLAVPVQDCRDIAIELAQAPVRDNTPAKAALVFGRERYGLTNEEMDRCTRLLRIPCNPDFSSLNLGSAVQVVSYECARALQSVPAVAVADEEAPASTDAMQHFFDHLQRIMVATGFLDLDKPRHLMRRIRRYFERNRPTDKELNILRGILSATEKPYPPKKPQ